MNVCGMKEFCNCHLTYSVVASRPFAIPDGMCLLDAHFRISPEIVGHPGTFHLLFYGYTINSDIQIGSYTFHLYIVWK